MFKVKKNAEGRYKYADLAEITSLLEREGIEYYQYTESLIVGEVVYDYIMTVLVDKDGKEGVPLRGSRITESGLSNSNNPAQARGAAETYARRYSLLMALGLATTDDDDGEMFSTDKATPREIANVKSVCESKGVSFSGWLEKEGKSESDLTAGEVGRMLQALNRRKG